MVRALVHKAVELGAIEESKAEICEYGLEDFLYNFFTCCIFLIAGMVIHQGWYMLLFMLVHIPLRMHAGGIHCKTRWGCFLASSLITVIVFALPFFFTVQLLSNIMLWAALLGVLVVWRFAPIEDLRKPLNGEEQKWHGKVSRFIYSIGVIGGVACFAFSAYKFSYFIEAALVVVVFQLIFGRIRQKAL